MESAWVFSVHGVQWPVTTCMDGFFLLPKRKPLFPQLARVSGKSQEAIQVFSASFSFPVTKLTEASSLEHKDPSFSSLALPFSLPYKVANFFLVRVKSSDPTSSRTSHGLHGWWQWRMVAFPCEGSKGGTFAHQPVFSFLSPVLFSPYTNLRKRKVNSPKLLPSFFLSSFGLSWPFLL